MTPIAPVSGQGISFFDERAARPAIGFGDYGALLVGVIPGAGVRPFSVGTFGGYGSGTTAVPRSVRRAFRQSETDAIGSETGALVHRLRLGSVPHAKGRNPSFAFPAMVSRARRPGPLPLAGEWRSMRGGGSSWASRRGRVPARLVLERAARRAKSFFAGRGKSQ